ncbi:hypothetical protein [Mycobacterium sp. Root135]|uniref:hypothetical protein n=1 Tax=Mycobacterium sp. Root135 TaxID=1736457 RepID=UPI0012EA8AB9|nr:hypothetical protein [Mycobacterium sp. Root135]
MEARLFAKNSVPTVVGSSVVLSTSPGEGVSLVVESAEVRIRHGDVTYNVSPEELRSRRGALIGCDRPDGYVASNDDCWGQVLFTFTAVQDTFLYEGLTAPEDKEDFSNYAAITRTTGAFRAAVRYTNVGKVDQNNLRLGHVAADSPPGFEILSFTSQIKRDDQPWQDVTLDDQEFYKVPTVSPGESVSFASKIEISDWELLCQRGVERVYITVWPDNFNRIDVPISVYPESGQC